MRDLVYYIATTLDGFIAHKDGSFEGFPWDDEYGADLFASFPETFPAHLHGENNESFENKWFDTVLMGRKTYEVGLQEGITNPYPTLAQYVFSRTMQENPDENVNLITKKGVQMVKSLKQKPGKAIWLCGGSDLASTLLKADLINKIIIKLNPVMFGSGIPLFSNEIKQTGLKLTDSKIYNSGHMLLYYQVER